MRSKYVFSDMTKEANTRSQYTAHLAIIREAWSYAKLTTFTLQDLRAVRGTYLGVVYVIIFSLGRIQLATISATTSLLELFDVIRLTGSGLLQIILWNNAGDASMPSVPDFCLSSVSWQDLIVQRLCTLPWSRSICSGLPVLKCK